MRLGTIIFFFLLHLARLQAQTYQDHFKAAAKAYETEDYKLMLSEARNAYQLRPQHQTLIYYLSMAYALNDEVDSANYWLRKLITIDAENYDIDREDFNAIRQSEGYKSVKAYQQFMNKAIIQPDTALVIPDTQLHIEDVAFDTAKNRYLVSSINKRNIFWVENNQLRKLFQKDFPLAITGMEMQDKILWFTAAGFPEAGIPAGDPELDTSILYKADLERGVLLDSFSVSDGAPHIFGDLLITENNEVLVSDSKANKIYLLNERELVEWFYADEIISLQGIAHRGDDFLLADYSQGLFHFNSKNKKLTAIQPTQDLSLKGIDGLYTYKDGLIAIQNGVNPHRVTYLQWDRDSKKIISFRYLEKNHPAMGEPTLGFIANQHLYYVANSFWGINKNGKISNSDKIQPVILYLKLQDILGF
ncbi:hypothetical protein GCM10011506_08070 [Marivirga lumbricoides]|uniref:Tetratricopeptide repeat protein n=1 Tax=Marivirga lumbricoides TaxID=1046115 RepID=A0ABQ1LPK6_9BACT|nr:hypothetical protein GCM10011506_08070 [Marivirga lumbricoides]